MITTIMPAPKTGTGRLCDLLDISEEHKQIDEVLLRHQEALIGLEFTHALGALEEVARRLSRHIRREEELLISAYAELGDFAPAAHPDVFYDEHRRIERTLKDLLASARGLTQGAGVRRAVILLLERETRFKGLLSHHAQREGMFLYARLKEHWTAAGKKP
jgi:hypothetical protein